MSKYDDLPKGKQHVRVLKVKHGNSKNGNLLQVIVGNKKGRGRISIRWKQDIMDSKIARAVCDVTGLPRSAESLTEQALRGKEFIAHVRHKNGHDGGYTYVNVIRVEPLEPETPRLDDKDFEDEE